MLSLICSHPAIFVKHLEGKRTTAKKAATTAANGDARQLQPHELGAEDDYNVEEGDLLPSPFNSPLPSNSFLRNASAQYGWARPLLDSHSGEGIQHSFRVLAFREIVKHAVEIGDSTLVFSHSLTTLDLLEAVVKEMSVEYLRLDGSTPMKDRQKSVKQFNAGACDVFLISTEAGGLGLNLFGANRVIVFDFRWSPMWEQQAIGRAYRLGQTKHVFVYRFRSGGTLQDKLWNATQFKSRPSSTSATAW